jgi:hypothetical protein
MSDTAPTLRPDGSILKEPGYDSRTGIYYDPRGVEFPAIPPEPSREEALSALATLDALIEEFPFVDNISRSVALSLFLTVTIRLSLRTAPMHAISANVAGTGKSKLANVASILATGHEAPR